MLHLGMIIFIEQLSLWCAIFASMLIALNLSISGWAFLPYILSNICTLYLLKKSDAPKVITYQTWWFIMINCVGIIRWLV